MLYKICNYSNLIKLNVTQNESNFHSHKQMNLIKKSCIGISSQFAPLCRSNEPPLKNVDGNPSDSHSHTHLGNIITFT